MTSQLKHVRGAILLLLALAATVQLEARTWRLNPVEDAKADFTSINDAMADERVQPGDELLLEPGYYSEEQKVTKENITITGPGYFLSANYNWPAVSVTHVPSIEVKSNCDNCTIRGLELESIIVNSYNHNTTITRCKLDRLSASGSIGLTFEQCFITGNSNYYSAYVGENTIVRNNILKGAISGSNNCSVEYNTIIVRLVGSIYSPDYLIGGFKYSQINNNIIINTNAAQFENNIKDMLNAGSTNSWYNNVFSTTEVNQSHPYNHYVGATVENTFIDELIADRYYLRDDSAAKGGAQGGGDCGAFGGAHPYVLSGIPLHSPYITEAIVPGRPTDGKVSVRIKMTVQNE